MLSAGCDLHKQTITICVVNQMRIVILRRTLACADEEPVVVGLMIKVMPFERVSCDLS